MDTIQASMDELSTSILRRMEEFEAKLVKSSSAPATVTNLTAEFCAYRGVVSEALKMLQLQLDNLARNVDRLEMQSRRKILLLHGVEERKDEDVTKTILNIITTKLEIPHFSVSHIKHCQRLGRSSSPKKPRPILLKLHDISVRDKIWFTKTKLRGTGTTVSEFLTKTRHDVFMAAREKFGINRSWTKEGSVFVMCPDGVRRRVLSLIELNSISEVLPKPSVAPKTGTSKSKRTAAVKK